MGQTEQQQIFEDWLRNHQGLFFKVVRARMPSLRRIKRTCFRRLPRRSGVRSRAFSGTRLLQPGFIAWRSTWPSRGRKRKGDIARENKGWMESSLQFFKP